MFLNITHYCICDIFNLYLILHVKVKHFSCILFISNVILALFQTTTIYKLRKNISYKQLHSFEIYLERGGGSVCINFHVIISSFAENFQVSRKFPFHLFNCKRLFHLFAIWCFIWWFFIHLSSRKYMYFLIPWNNILIKPRCMRVWYFFMKLRLDYLDFLTENSALKL